MSKKNELNQEQIKKVSGGYGGDDGSTIPPEGFEIKPAVRRSRVGEKLSFDQYLSSSDSFNQPATPQKRRRRLPH